MYCRPTILLSLPFCSPGTRDGENARLRHSLDWRGWRFLKCFDRLCRINGLSEPCALKRCLTKNSRLQNICFYATSVACSVVKIFCPAHLILNTPRMYVQRCPMGARRGGRGANFFPFTLLELQTILEDTFVLVFVAVHY
jgi:hypothetical protein